MTRTAKEQKHRWAATGARDVIEALYDRIQRERRKTKGPKR